MSPPAPPSLVSGLAGSPLRARRCLRHPPREAVARCPSCSGFFCRECVVEHNGQLTCSACLARETAPRSARSSRTIAAGLREAALLTAAVLVLWLTFYEFGVMLLRIPPAVHDGTFWKRFGASATEDADGAQS